MTKLNYELSGTLILNWGDFLLGHLAQPGDSTDCHICVRCYWHPVDGGHTCY